MDIAISRRGLFQGVAAVGGALALSHSGLAKPLDRMKQKHNPGWVVGKLTGAQAVAESLKKDLARTSTLPASLSSIAARKPATPDPTTA